MEATARNRKTRFGAFEVDLRSGELYKHGIRLKLQDQPFQVLALLLEHSGDVVTREELREKLWPAHTFVDFDTGLNSVIKKLRDVLSDSAEEPRYIETLPRRGYRFIALVENGVPAPSAVVELRPVPVPPSEPTLNLWSKRRIFVEEKLPPGERLRPSRRWAALAATFALLTLAWVGYFYWTRQRVKPVPETQRTVVAVLPFTNLTGDASQEYFSDGLTEEMIGQLGRLDPQRLGVIARTSVMQFKQNGQSLGKVGSELGAQYVMEGSVRRDAGKVRISAQLIQTKDQTRIWSREYDRELSNLLALQTEIAREIAGEIRITLNEKNRAAYARPVALPTRSYEAYDLYLKGLYFWNQRTAEGFEKAVDYFQQAVDKDPSYAGAYAGLAESYTLISGYSGLPPRDFMQKARAAAQRAIELDDSLAEAHTARAVVAQDLDWDWPTAEKEYRRAIALDPNYATAHQWFAEYLALMGRFDEAYVEMEQARVLDPLSLIMASDHGVILYYARHHDQAIQQFQTVLEMDPAYARALTVDLAYLEKGMYAEAQSSMEQRRSLFGQNPWYVGLSIYVDGRSGRTVEAYQALERLQQMNRAQHIDPLIFTYAYIGLKNKNQALSYMEKAYAEHSVSLTALKVDPLYDTIRREPRFKKLLLQMGLSR